MPSLNYRLQRKSKYLLIRAMAHPVTARWFGWVHRSFAFRDILRSCEELKVLPEKETADFPLVRQFDVQFPGTDIPIHYNYEKPDMLGFLLYRYAFIPWETSTAPVFLSLARRARGVVDVGANVGAYTLLTLAANKTSSIVAIEPNPEMFQRLQTNVRLNDPGSRVQSHQAAASNYSGKANLHVPEECSMASLNPQGFRGLEGKLVEVPVITLDTLLPPDFPVDLIKIDVEGFEPDVLAGMTSILKKWTPSIILECHPDDTSAEINAILKAYPYRFYHIDDDGIHPRESIAPQKDQRRHNWLCLPTALDLAEIMGTGK